MKRLLFVAALVLLPFGLLFAGGAGGMNIGVQLYDPGFSNADLQTLFLGGYGYGVTPSGQRIGGFGMGFFNGMDTRRIAGGVGGLLAGQELRAGPLMVAINLLTGFGGVGTNAFSEPGGYALVFGQATAELGFAFTPWMMLVGYGGMQVMANFVPGRPFSSLVYYSPVAGLRMAWGSFRS